ncbi:hypothetical protein AB1Y20_022549 [Prymnesium parvum]|uniref:sn-1-specific diacylglycerol lipase n=1 Tax=Prymnesium parvum TaxID=97485 RepID=A0AB34JIA7_PRYPA
MRRLLLLTSSATLLAITATAAFIYRNRAHYRAAVLQWRAAVDGISQFASSIHLREDIRPVFVHPLPILLAVLSRAQRPPPSPPCAEELSAETLAAASHALRFACAAYGHALMALFGLVPLSPAAPPSPLSSAAPQPEERACIARYCGLPPADLRLLLVGDSSCLAHFVALDRAHAAVVLALRGTASLSDAFHDAVAFTHPFCGGHAHAGMARMARAVWAAAAEAVLELLAAHPTYTLVLTGHSLGAGTAALLTLFLFHERGLRAQPGYAPGGAFPPRRTPIKCFAFAPPPVFEPLAAAPAGSLEAVVAVVVGADCVPFASLASGRLLFSRLHALDDAIGALSSGACGRLALGLAPLPPRALAAVDIKPTDLPLMPGAPTLCIPARVVAWLYPPAEGAPPLELHSPARLADRGITLRASMVADHMIDVYTARMADAVAELSCATAQAET